MLTLNNLTPGERYEIQLWTNDCRIATSGKNYNPGKTTNIADLGGMVKLEQNSQKSRWRNRTIRHWHVHRIGNQQDPHACGKQPR